MSAFDEVLQAVPEADRSMVALAAQRFLNMVGGMRPSDAARSEVSHYQRDPEAYRQQFKAERGLI